MDYYLDRQVALEFDAAVDAAEAALADEGFGVLCDIDVREKMEAKLGIDDYRRYRILGACNPPLAREALDAEAPLGVLPPCNVVVYEEDGGTVVAAVDPDRLLSVVDNEALEPIAADVRERLTRALEELPGAATA